MTNTSFTKTQVGSFTREGLSTIVIEHEGAILGWAEWSPEDGAYFGRTADAVRIEGMSATTTEIAERLLALR